MELLKEISDFLLDKGIGHDTVTVSGHSVVIAHITDGRSISVVPAPIFAERLEDAEKYSEGLSSCIESIISDTGERPFIVSEDRWHNQAAMTRARLLAHMGIFTQIYARNCEIRKIDKKTAADFLNTNHSYGDASCRYRYGLYLKRHTGHNAGSAAIEPGCLVGVATFSNARRWIKGDKAIRSYEWTRYASLPGVRLSGGMGRLLQAFIDEVQPDDIMTYADLEWSEGKVYEALGFTLDGQKSPVFFAVDTSTWDRHAVITGRTMVGVDMPPTAKGCIGGSNVLPVTCRYFQNLGSNKYRLKLTEY